MPSLTSRMRLPFRRKKDKSSSGEIPAEFLDPRAALPPLHPPTARSGALAADLPSAVLERIFSFVTPHASDESYEPCERVAIEEGCMLCDLRDLSHCARTSRVWRRAAIKVLYHSVRIDPVHYCRREEYLAERRKKHRFDKNGVPEDPAQARLRLLRRTVRDDPTRLGKLVRYLKLPYMLRESAYVEIAQTLAVLPNLYYVDLPEGMFSDEPSLATLRMEVQARCPNLRKTTYNKGSEQSFAMLASGQVWSQLEVLEISGLNLDPMTMRAVLGSLANLRALKVSETESLSDEVLSYDENLPSLPPLEELVIKDTPRVTASGILDYLAWQETQAALKVLTLKDTGVHPSAVNDILMCAPSLKVFALQAKVNEPFPQSVATPLGSSSLETLRYEVSGTQKVGPYAGMEEGYHAYLATSILGGNFPKLRRLYVHDDGFPDRLQNILPPPNAAFAAGQVRRGSASSHMGRPSVQLSPPSNKPSRHSAMNSVSSLGAPSGGGGGFGSPPGMGSGGAGNHLNPYGNGSAPSRPISKVPPTNRFSSNNPFASRVASPPPTNTLEVFTKSDEFAQWNFARLDSSFNANAATAGAGGRSSNNGGRPVSSYGLAADVAGQGWNQSEARRSVMVGNGTGGYLALPTKGGDRRSQAGAEEMGGLPLPSPGFGGGFGDRPMSSSGDRRKSRDLWGV